MQNSVIRAALISLVTTFALAIGASIASASDPLPHSSKAAKEAAHVDTSPGSHTASALERAAKTDANAAEPDMAVVSAKVESSDLKVDVDTADVEPVPVEQLKEISDEVGMQIKIKEKPLGKNAEKEVEHSEEKAEAIKVAPAKPVKKANEPAKKEVVIQSVSPSGDVTSETSLRWLQNGNTRYLKKTTRADGKSALDRKRLLKGQSPHAIILSCSDSRVPPEVVFDQALGEVYVVRVAGEALDSAVIASLEHAVQSLGPKLLVVMGHSRCDAVEAALNFKEGDSSLSPEFEKLLSDIRPRLKTVQKETPTETLEVESAVNADGVARDLVRRSELIRKKVEAGELTIKTALYRMDSGKVTFY